MALKKSFGINSLPNKLYKILFKPWKKGEKGPKPAIINKFIIIYNEIIIHNLFKKWTKSIFTIIYKKKRD